uniref:SAP domain-containing protein n=1 Tax=viral metagenome TaxID=1070528 RepID=A0A6C0JBM5_9ZZZZ
MNYNYIVNPLTNRKCDIHSRTGQRILNQYIIQDGGACSICGAEGVTKATCPQNPSAKNPKPEKHKVKPKDVAKVASPPKPVPKVESPPKPVPKVESRPKPVPKVVSIPKRIPKPVPLPKAVPKVGVSKKEDFLNKTLLKILKGPRFASYFENVMISADKVNKRNILLLGEFHDVFRQCSPNKLDCFSEWIKYVGKNSPFCIDFFLEGMTIREAQQGYYIKPLAPKIYTGGKGTKTNLGSLSVLELRTMLKDLGLYTGGLKASLIKRLEDAQKVVPDVTITVLRNLFDKDHDNVKKYPYLRYHSVDIRQIHDHHRETIGEDTNLTKFDNVGDILQTLKDDISEFFIEEISEKEFSVVKSLGEEHPEALKYRKLNDELFDSVEKISKAYSFNMIDYLLNDTSFIEIKGNKYKSLEMLISKPSLTLLKSIIGIKKYNNFIRLTTIELNRLASYVPDMNKSIIFIKKVIDKQFRKSYLTKEHFKENQDIWVEEGDLENPNIYDFYMRIMIMDIYTLCRMFAKFDVDKLERGPNNCKLFSTPKNIIFYGGEGHTNIYKRFIDSINLNKKNINNFNIYNEEQTCVDFTDKKQYKNGFQSKYNIGYNFFENAL